MAMIEIDLGEFVDGLIAKKARDGTVDEVERARARRELLTIADKAVDVAIMRAVFRNVLDRSKSKRTMDSREARLHAAISAVHRRGDLTQVVDVLLQGAAEVWGIPVA